MNLEPKCQKLFLADDDQDNQLIFMEAVMDIDSSIVIETAFDGKHALTRLEAMETLPELIFLDINMPLMDGFECLRELKAV